MKKILHITRDSSFGQFQIAKKICLAINKKGYENNLFCYSSNIYPNNKYPELSFEQYYIPQIFDEEIIRFSLLNRIKKKLKNKDIIFYHNIFNYSSLIIAIFLKIFTNKKSISLFHSNISYNDKGGFIRELYFGFRELIIMNIMSVILDKAIFITNSQKKEFSKKILLKKYFSKKSRVIHNFIERDYIIKSKIEKKYFNIIFVGNICKRKGVLDLFNLINKFSKKNINFKIIGNGELKEKIPKSSNVTYLGLLNKDQIKKEYDNSPILILPSYAEVFPVVIQEAMARGLVILVSDIPGMREIIKEGRNGYLFPPGDVEKMKKLILYLKNNPKEIERISKNNLKDIWKFTAEKQVPKYIKVYKEVLK